MSTTNTTYNPLLRATRAAFRELTTPEARRWYSQQLQTSAAIAQRITQPGLTLVRRWIGASRGQVAVVEPVQTNTLTQAAAPEQTDVVVEPVQAAVVEPKQAISPTEASAEAADLVQETAPPTWAATEGNDEPAGVDYEVIEDSLDLTMVSEDDPLPEGEIPFDNLECGPPFLSEEDEDTSFYQAEDDEDADSLTYEETKPDPSATTSELSAMIQAYYMRKNSVSAELAESSSAEAIAPAETIDEPVQDDDTTELRPWTVLVASEDIEASATQASETEPDSSEPNPDSDTETESVFDEGFTVDDKSPAKATLQQIESEAFESEAIAPSSINAEQVTELELEPEFDTAEEDGDLADFEYLSRLLETASDSEVDPVEEDGTGPSVDEPTHSVAQAYSLD
jgi:hypothetical protein